MGTGLALLVLCPPSTPRGPIEPREFDLSVEAFTAPSLLVLEAGNQLVAVTKNHGNTPVRAAWELSISNDAAANAVREEQTIPFIHRSSQRILPFPWDGKHLRDGGTTPPPKGSLERVFKVRPSGPLQPDPNPDNNERKPARVRVTYDFEVVPSKPPADTSIPVGVPDGAEEAEGFA